MLNLIQETFFVLFLYGLAFACRHASFNDEFAFTTDLALSEIERLIIVKLSRLLVNELVNEEAKAGPACVNRSYIS